MLTVLRPRSWVPAVVYPPPPTWSAPAALTSLRQYKEVGPSTFSQSHVASVDLQLSKVKALLRDVQASGMENGHRLETIFRTCLVALQQLEERATSLSNEFRKQAARPEGDGLPLHTSGVA
jgi:hypothetical protein